jgi:hypothetical protein
MSDSKNSSTAVTQQDSDNCSTFSRTTTLYDQADTSSSSVYTLKPELSTIAEDGVQEENKWKKSVKDAYLKFEALTPHGKDRLKNRLILQERKKNGVDPNYKPNIMWARTGTSPWGLGGFRGI